jgi:four helix bundle protein
MGFRFEKLDIWHEANQYARDIYKITKKFPRPELFSLSDQLKRAANSVAANIAEGSGSSSKKEFIYFLNVAIKSAYETVALTFRAEQEGYVNDKMRKSIYEKAEILIKKIQSFKRSLKRQ